MTDEQPKLDYWMLGIIEESVKTEIKRVGSRFGAAYVRGQLGCRNKWTNLGQLQLILDRMNEMRIHYDNEIKGALPKKELCNGAVPHEWIKDPKTNQEKCRWCGLHKQELE